MCKPANTVFTMSDSREESFNRKEARLDALARKCKPKGMTDAQAQVLASNTDPRIGVLLRVGRNSRTFPVFYAYIGSDPYSRSYAESCNIADIVRVLAEGGAA